jgi:hypothetical protein
MASNDPTDTGGLFIGRRPGTAPVRYRDDVPPSSERRRRADNLLARLLLALEVLLCLSLLGPQPLVWLWVGSQVDYLTGYVTAGISTVMLGCLASLMLTMAAAKRVDHAGSWSGGRPATARSAGLSSASSRSAWAWRWCSSRSGSSSSRDRGRVWRPATR